MAIAGTHDATQMETMTMTLSDTQKLTLATILVAVNQGDPIMGKGSAPSGHVYARLMGTVGLSEYQNLIRVLQESDMLLPTKGHVLRVTELGASIAEEISAIIRSGADNVTIN